MLLIPLYGIGRSCSFARLISQPCVQFRTAGFYSSAHHHLGALSIPPLIYSSPRQGAADQKNIQCEPNLVGEASAY